MTTGCPCQPSEVRFQFDEQEHVQDQGRIGLGSCPGDCLRDLNDGDTARNKQATAHGLLKGGCLRLVEDQLGQRRGIQIQAAHRGSDRRSASSDSVADMALVEGQVAGSLVLSGFLGGETRPASISR